MRLFRQALFHGRTHVTGVDLFGKIPHAALRNVARNVTSDYRPFVTFAGFMWSQTCDHRTLVQTLVHKQQLIDKQGFFGTENMT
jgi:hypothetical protein